MLQSSPTILLPSPGAGYLPSCRHLADGSCKGPCTFCGDVSVRAKRSSRYAFEVAHLISKMPRSQFQIRNFQHYSHNSVHLDCPTLYSHLVGQKFGLRKSKPYNEQDIVVIDMTIPREDRPANGDNLICRVDPRGLELWFTTVSSWTRPNGP